MIHIVAGHSDTDSGAIAYDGTKEADLTKDLRDRLVTRLNAAGYAGSTMQDDDSHSLIQTIRAINDSGASGLVLDLHFNYNHPTASGCEVFYSANTSGLNRQMAQVLSNTAAIALGVPNRGAKPDTMSHHGRLGILRDVVPPALLLEVCFLNEHDLKQYRKNITYLVEESAKFVNDYLK